MHYEVAVLGSLNFDIVFACEAMPCPGETILCDTVKKGPGGKGLNQAVASRRAGATTILLGAVGADGDGETLLRVLEEADVSTDGVRRLNLSHTGLAHIIVDYRGENSIVVASGANKSAELGADLFETVEAAIFLAQLEMDVDLVSAFFARGKAIGRPCVLNAAPALAKAASLLSHCDFVIVNEHELALFCDVDLSNAGIGEYITAGRSIVTGQQSLLVTLGAAGVIWITAENARHFAATKVEPIDTTGAGDCFCGVFAASMAKGQNVPDAIERAMAAAAVAVTRKGAAHAIPLAIEYDG